MRRVLLSPLRLCCVIAVGVWCAGCHAKAPALQRFEYIDFVMAARARVVVYGEDDAITKAAATAAFERMRGLEGVMSDYRRDSEAALLSARPHGQPQRVSDDLCRVLVVSQRIAELSGGAFDITAGPATQLWRSARNQGRLPREPELAAARKRMGWRWLVLDDAARTVTLLKPGMKLDFGGIGKGFAVDQAMRELCNRGFSQSLVSLAGDIVVGDPPPGRQTWIVTVHAGNETPERELHLCHQAVSTSGDLEQFIEVGGRRYSHILDPRTGVALEQQTAVTVVAPDCMTADALATALSVLGREEAEELLKHFPAARAFFAGE